MRKLSREFAPSPGRFVFVLLPVSRFTHPRRDERRPTIERRPRAANGIHAMGRALTCSNRPALPRVAALRQRDLKTEVPHVGAERISALRVAESRRSG